MRDLLPLLLIVLVVVFGFQVYLRIDESPGTFVLETKEVAAGGSLTGLLTVAQQRDIRPAEQEIPVDVRVLEVGEVVKAVVNLETADEMEIEVEYYILDLQAEKVSEDSGSLVVEGQKGFELELETPEKAGEYIFHVTVKGEGISTDIDVFRVS